MIQASLGCLPRCSQNQFPFLIQEVIQKITGGDFQILSDERFQEAGPKRCSAARVPPCQARGSAEDSEEGTKGRGPGLPPAFTTPRTSGLPPSKMTDGFRGKAAAVPMFLLSTGAQPLVLCQSASWPSLGEEPPAP